MQLKMLMLMGAIGCASAKRPVPKTVKADPIVAETAPNLRVTETPFGPWSTGQGHWPDTAAISDPQIGWAHQLRGPITHPMTTDGLRIFTTAAGTVYCFNADGQILWEAQINADGSPIPYKDGVYVPTGLGVVQRIDVDTGKITKSFGGKHPIRIAPFTLGGDLVWIDNIGQMFGAAGKTSIRVPGPIIGASSDGESALIGTDDGRLHSLSADGVVWSLALTGPMVGHPLIYANQVFVAFLGQHDEPGGMMAIDKITGTSIWSAPFSHDPIQAPAIGEHLVVANRKPELVAIDRNHGGIRWRAPGPAQDTIQPAVADDAIYTGDGSGRLRRVDMNDGGTVWKMELGSPITGEGVVINNRFVVGTADGRIIAVGNP